MWKNFFLESLLTLTSCSMHVLYCRHGGRTTITTDDVMLLARRNEGLAAVLGKSLAAIEASKGRDKAKARR